MLVVIDQAGQFHDAATAYLEHLTSTGSSPNTVRSYGSKVAWFLSWCAASGVDWRAATLTDVVRWKTAVAESTYTVGRGEHRLRTARSVNVWMSATVSFYTWASESGEVPGEIPAAFFHLRRIAPGQRGGETGVLRQVRRPELTVRESTKSPKWLERESDRHALAEQPMNLRDWFLVCLLYSTGMRIGEALGLYRVDMHFLADNAALGCRLKGPHVHIRQRDEVNPSARAKSGARTIPVAPDVVHLYDDYRHDRAERLRDLGDDCPRVFVNLYGNRNVGRPLTYDTVKDLFERLERRLGTRIRPHMLRHTRATAWLHGLEGPRVEIDEVRDLLGHASVATTGIYTHTVSARLRAAVEATAPAVRGARPDGGA